MKNRRKEIYKAALQKWGIENQLQMLGEESLELSLATRRLYRKGPSEETINEISGEIADTEIMIEQTKMMLEYWSVRKRVGYIKRSKIARLANRLKG
ncbi:MAG: hypothetical protein JKX82_04775 [Oleispira sp.]|nr:hypothetical protein [Oleispira sp.]